MAAHVRPQAIRLGVAVVLLIALAFGGWTLWRHYEEKYTVTTEPDSGQAVTRIITARPFSVGYTEKGLSPSSSRPDSVRSLPA